MRFHLCLALFAAALFHGCGGPERDFSMGCTAEAALPVANGWAGDGATDVTFIAFGDCQMESGAPDRNELNARAINAVDQGLAWPKAPFGFEAPVGHVRGVIMAGDICQHARDGRDGVEDEIGDFMNIYGLCGNAALKFPIFEGYGNHDYFVYRHLGYRLRRAHPGVEMVVARNPFRAGLANIAPADHGHYSWDWDKVHFVQVNLCPSDVVPQTDVSGDRDPRMALTFLRDDLDRHVKGTPKRVVIISHYGFYAGWDFSGWWTEAEAEAYYDVIKDYDIIAHIHGHAHNTEHYQWHGIDVFNVGSPYYENNGWNPDGRGRFAIFRITNDTLYAGDAAWNPAHPESDLQFPAQWSAIIPLRPAPA
ncbi:MAG: hypothetical protein IT368_01025 [Candidatus Hydrogenedentes bacterium]|nr:hypothetical protein [Candidatus Hydrogenedentota bacterium]